MKHLGKRSALALGLGLGLAICVLPVAGIVQAAPPRDKPPERAVVSRLPKGKTIATATPVELAKAVQSAVREMPVQACAIVSNVLAQLGPADARKALAVIDFVVPVVSEQVLPTLVQAAVQALSTQVEPEVGLSARSALGQMVSQEAITLAPSQAVAIATAVSPLLTTDGGSPSGPVFQGPRGISNPANFSNSGGIIVSPSS